MTLHRTRPDPYEGTPRIIANLLRTDTSYLTWADDISRPATEANTRTRYCMVGGDYGWLYGSNGSIRFFASRSGAYKAAKRAGYLGASK